MDLLTIPEVMEILKVTRMTLSRMTKAGNIQAYQFGKSIRYKREDVEKALIPKKTNKKIA